MTASWSDLDSEAREADQMARLKRERDSLARRLYEAKNRHDDYLLAVTKAVGEAVAGVSVRPVRVPARSVPDHGLVVIAQLSDLQTGKITPDYNTEVCRERVLRYADEIIKIGRTHKSRECVVPMLGDIIEGCDIFPGQSYLVDSTLYDQVFNTTPVILADFLRQLLTYFRTVRVEAVQGNHGRIGRKGQYSGADNGDKMAYRIAQLLLRDEPRLEFNIADLDGPEAAWFKIMEVGRYSALLFHGDQIQSHNGIPFLGLQKKVNSWASGGIAPGVTFTDAMCGHFHQAARIPINQRTVWMNGSIESYNTFAQEKLAGQSEPTQWTLICDPAEGRITASYAVPLR